MILYIENPKDSTKENLLELINSVKLQDTKSSYKNFLYTDNKLSERESKKTIPFKIASKRIKYLGINLTKEVKDLYTKNILHKAIYRFNTIPIKIPVAFFTEIEQSLKLYGTTKDPK